MQEGFYKVTHAPRWTGEFHVGSGRVAFASINETKEFDGLVGYFDKRMQELSDELTDIMNARKDVAWSFVGDSMHGLPATKPYAGCRIPIIFSNEVGYLRNITQDPFFTTFFARSEIETITENEAEKALGKMTMRRYGDIKVMNTYSTNLGHWIMRVITPDNPALTKEPALCEIPFYIPCTQRREIEKTIKMLKELYKDQFESIDEAFQASAVM